MNTILRAAVAYLFLLLVVRVIGRRPGAQMTPFEFVLIFFIGGISIQAVVGEDHSLVNAFTAICAIALMHVLVASAKQRFPVIGRLVDGTPLLLLKRGEWQSQTMAEMRVQDVDVMEAARSRGISDLGQIKYAILERNGGVSIICLGKDELD